jgi:flagellar hook-associated protein 1 FlgK
VFQDALTTVQNNITNTNTPGYASQSVNFVSQPFDLLSGLVGGVAAKGLNSARNEYAEEEVRRQASSLGMYESQASATATIASNFDPSGNTGIPAALNQLLQSFSAWSLNPNDNSARQQILGNAGSLATTVHQLATSLSNNDQDLQGQISGTVQQINNLTSQIQQLNVAIGQSQVPGQNVDPGLDAQLHNDLQQLSELVDFSQVFQPNGTVTVVLSGGSPLVIGDQQFALTAKAAVPAGSPNPGAPPTVSILDSNGNDITSQITAGKLGGLLDAHNRVMASILGDGKQAGSLNVFAKSLADTVNGILQSGKVSVSAGAANGQALFTYDNSDATHAANSFAVNPNITTAGLAPVDSSGNANGNALTLASLANSTAGGGIGGQTFAAFFSQIAQFVGNENATAATNQTTQQQIVTQSEQLRDKTSAVSLDEQAIQLQLFQKSYEATAKLVNVLNSVTETTINMIQ